MKHLFSHLVPRTSYLGVISLLLLTACTSDDWDDEENKVPSTYVEPVNVSGYWYQSGAKLDGYSAYLGLHINSSGRGHATFYSKSAAIASFNDITTSVEGQILTINNCSAYSGNYLVESVNSNTLKIKQGNNVYIYYRGQELTPDNLATRTYWSMSSSGSSNYWRYYFNRDNTGQLYQYYNGKATTFPFNYTCSSETGQLSLYYTTPGVDPNFFDYACILNNSLLLSVKTETGSYSWYELK